MIAPTDLAAKISTNYEVLFRAAYNDAIAVKKAQFSGLVMELDLPDFQGNKFNLNWLGASPQIQRWVAEKRAQELNKFEWDITVVDWEATVRINLNALKDARWNIYEPRIKGMARNAARHEYNLISELLRGAETGLCYDGQYFFDTDHVDGASGSQSNEITGAGTSQANIETDYYKACAKLQGFLDDKGQVMNPDNFRPIVWIPNDPTLKQRFQTLKLAGLISQTSNILVNDFDLVVDPQLTDATDWYMMRDDSELKPFIHVSREGFHYEDNFGSGSEAVWSSRVGEASCVGRDAMTYGMWQSAVIVKNA